MFVSYCLGDLFTFPNYIHSEMQMVLNSFQC